MIQRNKKIEKSNSIRDRIYSVDGIAPTLNGFMGTGGGNVPLILIDMKRINKSQDGKISDVNGNAFTLSSGHYNTPKIIVNEMDNTIREGHKSDNSGGGGKMSMTEKHNWDLIKLEIRSNTKAGFEVAKEGDSINFSMPKSKTRRGRVGVGVAQTLDTQSNQGVITPCIVASRGRNKENPSDRTPGNKVEQRLEPRTDGQSNTLTSVEKDNYLLDTQLKIRRLTEVECERLQGFHDRWTALGNYDGITRPISRTQRYKLCSNAVTKTLPQMIGAKLLKLNKFSKNICSS